MKIIYTHTDEAPALATASLLPIVQAFAAAADVDVELRDISLAGRILAQFPELLDARAAGPRRARRARRAGQDARGEHHQAAEHQRVAAAAEGGDRRAAGQGLRDPRPARRTPPTRCASKYDAVKGSAVNPVLREGNSDRRAPASAKAFARKHPHSMGAWSPDSRSHVATMSGGDFRSTEQSVTVAADGAVRVEHVAADGTVTVLKERIAVLAGEVLDAAVMRRAALDAFLAEQVADAKAQGVLFSVHLKATMMKVSDPIIFGHAVRAVVGDVYDGLDASPNDGLGSLLTAHPEARDGGRRRARRRARRSRWSTPTRASRTSTRRRTSSSTPRCPRRSARRGRCGTRPASSRTRSSSSPTPRTRALYAETVDHCREHGAFDPATMGTTPNVGLMAQKAEEYGSHDKTFEIASAGTVRVVDGDGTTLLEHEVDAGDIWRMCQTKDARDRRTGCGSPSTAPARPARPRSSGSTRRARTTRSC